MKKEYIPRLFDQILEFTLKSKGAVLIEGPKWCDKSRTAERYAKTKINLLPRATRGEYVSLAKNATERFLNYGPKPILYDEWQIVSFIWDDLKSEIDSNDEFGQYFEFPHFTMAMARFPGAGGIGGRIAEAGMYFDKSK